MCQGGPKPTNYESSTIPSGVGSVHVSGKKRKAGPGVEAEAVKDAVMCAVGQALQPDALGSRAPEFLRGVAQKLARSKNRIIKDAQADAAEKALIGRVLSDPQGQPQEDVTTFVQIWGRSLEATRAQPIESYTGAYLACILRLVSSDFAAAFPSGNSEILGLLLREWYFQTHGVERPQPQVSETTVWDGTDAPAASPCSRAASTDSPRAPQLHRPQQSPHGSAKRPRTLLQGRAADGTVLFGRCADPDAQEAPKAPQSTSRSETEVRMAAVTRRIATVLRGGASGCSSIDELADTLDTPADLIVEATRMLHTHEAVFFDEGDRTVYLV